MYEQAQKGDSEYEAEKKGNKKGEVRVSLYEALQVLIEHGHSKEEILRNYSKEELSLFYEKCVKQDMKHNADFIEGVVCAIGGAFGGAKQVTKMIEEMRK